MTNLSRRKGRSRKEERERGKGAREIWMSWRKTRKEEAEEDEKEEQVGTKWTGMRNEE